MIKKETRLHSIGIVPNMPRICPESAQNFALLDTYKRSTALQLVSTPSLTLETLLLSQKWLLHVSRVSSDCVRPCPCCTRLACNAECQTLTICNIRDKGVERRTAGHLQTVYTCKRRGSGSFQPQIWARAVS